MREFLYALRVLLVAMPVVVALAPGQSAALPGPFTDVTAAAGLAYQHGYVASNVPESSHIAGGVACGDYDRDGWPDLYVVRGDIGPNLLFHNQHDGTFAEVGAAAGVAITGSRGSGPVFADVDGDGWPDLLVLGVDGTQPRLFHNQGDGTFADVTAASGLVFTRSSFSAAFADVDRDGDLDLFVTHWNTTFQPALGQPLELFWRNDGHGHFTESTAEAGIGVSTSPVFPVPAGYAIDFTFTPNFVDLDGDGWLDLVVTGDFQTSRVYHNDGTGHFVNVTTSVISDQNGMGSAIGDYDGDGTLDWFVSSIWDPNGPPTNGGFWGASGNRLYRNDGHGTFTDVTDAAGVREGYWGWGSTFADLDDDGDLDLVHVNGYGFTPLAGLFQTDPTRVFLADGHGTFTEASAAVGIDDTGMGRGIVAFDYDRDGDVDLFVANNGQPPRLYRNDTPKGARWLTVQLRDASGNTDAIGARVEIDAGGTTQVREIRAGSNYVSQDPPEAHFGLGAATKITALRVRWPDGRRTQQSNVAVDQRLVLDAPPPSPAPTTAEARCLLALNRAAAALAGAAMKDFADCVAAGGAGKLPAGQNPQQCAVANGPGTRLAKARAKTIAIAAKSCAATTSFGPSTAAQVNDAVSASSSTRAVFGPTLDGELADAHADAAAATCQLATAKGFAAVLAKRLGAFNACKARGLSHGTIAGPADLEACRADDPRGAIAKATAKLAALVQKKCAGVSLVERFKGTCPAASLDAFATCVGTATDCATCELLHGVDQIGGACHELVGGVPGQACNLTLAQQSVARQWNEELLAAIRLDLPRPPVHARNLFHFGVAAWDAWAAYDAAADGYLVHEKHTSDDPNRDRAIAISYAEYRLLRERFQISPNATTSRASFDARMAALGLDPAVTIVDGDSPAAVGNRIGAAVIAYGLTDGANEAGNYADPTYTPVNDPLIVKLPGNTMNDPTRWQPLALDVQIGQNGIPIPGNVQQYIGARWGGVLPFAIDFPAIVPPHPARLHDPATDAIFRSQAVELLRLSSELTPDDPTMIDISPNAFGNNSLGTNDGHGYSVNPVTGQPYTPQLVHRGDFGRVLAEFWADGPTSETPPGHWNVIANGVSDDPHTVKRIGGTGPIVDPLEWDVKLYFALNAAEHDAAVACWGTKRVYDSVRPISAIRWMASHGQSSDPAQPSYDPDGLPLVPGLIEVVTAESSAPGQRHAALAGSIGKIAVLAWPGPPDSPSSTYSGVRWGLAESWLPYQRKTFVTPAFPAFLSGHSTFSRAGAEILTRFTGSSYFPGGMGEYLLPKNHWLQFEIGPSTDVRLQWAQYYDAADQAGISRLWGGIHPAGDDFGGRLLGAIVGPEVWAKAVTYFDGSALP